MTNVKHYILDLLIKNSQLAIKLHGEEITAHNIYVHAHIHYKGNELTVKNIEKRLKLKSNEKEVI